MNSPLLRTSSARGWLPVVSLPRMGRRTARRPGCRQSGARRPSSLRRDRRAGLAVKPGETHTSSLVTACRCARATRAFESRRCQTHNSRGIDLDAELATSPLTTPVWPAAATGTPESDADLAFRIARVATPRSVRFSGSWELRSHRIQLRCRVREDSEAGAWRDALNLWSSARSFGNRGCEVANSFRWLGDPLRFGTLQRDLDRHQPAKHGSSDERRVSPAHVTLHSALT